MFNITKGRLVQKSKDRFSPLLLLLCSLSAEAALSPSDQTKLSAAFSEFKRGGYGQAISLAESVQGKDEETVATVAYFVATAQGKIQAFDKAVPLFQKAIALNHKEPSIYYEYGQALFATQQLQEAEAAFKQSIVKNFKVAASAYYIGFIRTLLEDSKTALDYYNRIQKLKEDNDKVKQAALFQIAEIEYEKVKLIEDKEVKVPKLQDDVLPLFERTKRFERGTPICEQAILKITEIQREITEHIQKMRNGIPIPRSPYSVNLTQSFNYDSNVITQASGTLVQVSYADSYISNTSFLGKYQYNIARTVSLIPELSLSSTFHSRRSQPKVYQNDNLVIGPSLRTKYEHMSHGSPATALFDVEYNYMLRDYHQAHQFPMYSRYWNVTLGERLKWFDTGTTTLKMGIKLFESYDPSRNSYSPSISLQQNIKIFDQYDWSNTLTADYLHARDDNNDEKNYKIRSSVTFSHLIGKIDVTPAFSFSVKDTMKQKGTRGNEPNYNPSITFNREIVSHLDGSLEYDYTQNNSLATTSYDYSKHEVKLSASLSY